MTLRRRWALSILAILLLFGVNLAVYFWGNTQRTIMILSLKAALERKDLVIEIRNTIQDRQNDTEVMEPLLASGAVQLETEELDSIRKRMSVIAEKIARLHELSGSSATLWLGEEFQRLGEAWFEVYEMSPPPPSTESDTSTQDPDNGETSLIVSRPLAYQRLHTEIIDRLVKLQRREAGNAERAEQDFAAVSELTDRITLTTFALSSLLAVGIALWFSRFLRGTFARYVTDEVAASVLGSPTGLALGGEKRQITLLMADLRGFSLLSERLPPEKVVAVINNFLGTMTEIIVGCGGTIDEFIGDAILVLFGAPTAKTDHAESAVLCAVKMQLAMQEVNEKNRNEALPAVEMGIGVHSGEVVVGNIGSEKRTKYGAVGPSVNLAAQIEANTVGGQILISESTLRQVAADLRIDGQLEIRSRGFGEAVRLYDVGGIGADHRLYLPDPGEALVALPNEIRVRFWDLEGSLTGAAIREGSLVGLSRRAAAVRSSADVPPLVNLKLEFVAGHEGATRPWLKAKVLAGKPRADDVFTARFTSLPPETAALLERLLSGWTREGAT